MVRAGARIIVDDVFLSGVGSRRRWEAALDGLDVLWVGVRCPADVAEAREIARGDRVVGMARSQADVVHDGMTYDVDVDTSRAEALSCARAIAAHCTPT
jgi:chloramphenicol 3-O phosphotransferase